MGQRRGLHGLRPSRRHPGRNWQLDVDYAHKLSPEQQQWLARFMDESYHSVPFAEGVSLHSRQQQRELWRSYKANERDALTRSNAFARTASLEPPSEDGVRLGFEGRLYSATEGHAPWAAEDVALASLDAHRAQEAKFSKARACPKRPRRLRLRPRARVRPLPPRPPPPPKLVALPLGQLSLPLVVPSQPVRRQTHQAGRRAALTVNSSPKTAARKQAKPKR